MIQSIENTRIETVNTSRQNEEQPKLGFWKSWQAIIELIRFIDEEEPGR
ncbi:hypothetical protein [Calothrix sp. PCC 6303]|nr:hypothetical protein [Calothrix sp. PCC 6303]AFY99337.1 hypothetical protein Cal6303_0232 [Calothrix sp. PCC 6303]